MKRHLSSLVFGFLGFAVGFGSCYVWRHETAQAPGAPVSQSRLVYVTRADTDTGPKLEWRQPLIQPTIPPRVVPEPSTRIIVLPNAPLITK